MENTRKKLLALTMALTLGIMASSTAVYATDTSNETTTNTQILKEEYTKLKKYAETYVTDYIELEPKIHVDYKKVWTVKFNKPIDKDSLKIGSTGISTKDSPIKVIDSNGKLLDLVFKIEGNNVLVKYSNWLGYKPGETYALVVTSDITSEEKNLGNILKSKKEVVMYFTIHESLQDKVRKLGSNVHYGGKNPEEKNGKIYWDGKLPTEEWIPNLNESIVNLILASARTNNSIEYIYMPSTSSQGLDSTRTEVSLFSSSTGGYLMEYQFNIRKNHIISKKQEIEPSKIIISMERPTDRVNREEIKANIRKGIPSIVNESVADEITNYIINNYDNHHSQIKNKQFGKYKIICKDGIKIDEQMGGGHADVEIINVIW